MNNDLSSVTLTSNQKTVLKKHFFQVWTEILKRDNIITKDSYRDIMKKIS